MGGKRGCHGIQLNPLLPENFIFMGCFWISHVPTWKERKNKRKKRFAYFVEGRGKLF